MNSHRFFVLPALSAGLLSVSLAQSYLTTTVAGSSRLLDGHPATSVPLRRPWGIAQDAAGNIYFADSESFAERSARF